MITIIDYGLGNVKAFANVYNSLNIPVTVANRVEKLKCAEKLILPGVGSFDHAMERLQNSGMREMLDELVLKRHIPILGICVGMQILAHSSEEGQRAGLGWLAGEVKKFDVSKLKHDTHLPHMGWNDVEPQEHNHLFRGIEAGGRFYFLHSYYFYCCQKQNILAVTDYGGHFACAINSNNIYGVQFHPEKSHHYGVQLLKNFANL